MILADSFCQNAKARESEFSTTANDFPLVVQFAANNVDDFVDASNLIYSYADGVDLNCGCPQRWAMKDGCGCALLAKPELIQDMVKGVRNSLPNTFSVSVKIRILKELSKTIDMCRQLEKCGVNFLTVHGRTPAQKSGGNVDRAALKEVQDSLKIPLVANGGVKTLADAEDLYKVVGCGGVMAASGLLTNPALFSGANRTPLSCVKLWMHMKDDERITFQCYHHHLVFMLDKVLNKTQKQVFNSLSTFESVDNYLNENILNCYSENLDFTYNIDEFVKCVFSDEITMKHAVKCRGCGKSVHYCICVKYDYNATDGNYFTSYVIENDVLDFMDTSMFNDPA